MSGASPTVFGTALGGWPDFIFSLWVVLNSLESKMQRVNFLITVRALKYRKRNGSISVMRWSNRRVEAICCKRKRRKRTSAGKGDFSRCDSCSTGQTNGKLFDWLLEEGVDGLPVLEGRTTRLEFLIKKVNKQLEFVSGNPELAPQARVLKLRRAELGLAMGDLVKGEAWLKEAIGDPKLPSDLAVKGAT